MPIDISSPPESQSLRRNDDAALTAQLLAGLTIYDRTAAQDRFMEWPHRDLSCADKDDIDGTCHEFHDGEPTPGDAEPTLGDAEPMPSDAEPTPGDAELSDKLIQRLHEIIRQPPSTVVKPFLSRPMLSDSDKIVAYRGNLLAIAVGPGCYKLLSIGEQILWNKRSLSLSDIPNASDPRYRVLGDYRGAPEGTKSTIMSSCKGIVGVAHRGYHTLNTASATKNHKRIGDCIVEVEWTDKILEPLPHLSYKETQGVKVVKTFETRADWHVFRGKTRADWEIYWFAKNVDTGDIPPDGRVYVVPIKKRPPKAIESAATSKKKSRARKPSPCAVGCSGSYSD